MRYFIFSILGLLAACSSPTTLVPVIENRPHVAIPVAQPLTLNSVNFKVITAENYQSFVDDIKNKKIVLFALDATNYQNLTLNLVEIKRYLDEQNSIIVMLKTVVNSDMNVNSDTKSPEKDKPKAP